MDYKKQGKANRAAGLRFELKVRKDLEDKGWIVDKWSNNVEFKKFRFELGKKYATKWTDNIGELIPAKHKFRGPGIPMAIGTGFPDFIALQWTPSELYLIQGLINLPEKTEKVSTYQVIGVEVKSNGYLTKEEKEKCKWLIDNDKFSKILIASKGLKRGEIIYKEYGK